MKPSPDALHSLRSARADGRGLAVVVTADRCSRGTFSACLPLWNVMSARQYETDERLRDCSPHIVIVSVADGGTEPTDAVIHASLSRAREQFPGTPLLLYAHLDDTSAQTLFKAHWWNIVGIMFEGVDDQTECAEAAIAAARAVWVSHQLSAALPPRLPSWLSLLFARVSAHGCGHLDVPTLAQFLRICARALCKRLAQLGLPCARDLIKLGQCLCMVDAVANGPWNVRSATRMIGYKQVRTVRRAARKHMASTPSHVAAEGGLDRAIACVIAIVTSAMSSHPTAWQRESARASKKRPH